MSYSSDSEGADLPTPQQLFDRLEFGTRHSAGTSSLNKHNTPHTRLESPGPENTRKSQDENPRVGRRSSPRLRERHSRVDQAANPSRASLPTLPLPAGTNPFATDGDRQRHVDLANELFPPSPPRTTTNAQVPGETVISDSEPERGERLPFPVSRTKNQKTPRRRRPRISTTFAFDDDDSDAHEAIPGVEITQPALQVEQAEQDELTRTLSGLSLVSSSATPRARTRDRTFRSRSISPAKPSLSPAPSNLSHFVPQLNTEETRLGDLPSIRQPSTQTQRRITISVIGSDSSSDSSDDEAPQGRRDLRQTSAVGSDRSVQSAVGTEEIVMIETDDEGTDEDRGATVLPVLEPDFGSPRTPGGNESGRPGGYGYKGMDDVWENDGVLIYDPTPKKRPTKLPIKLSPAPFSYFSNPVLGAEEPKKSTSGDARTQTASPTKRASPKRGKSRRLGNDEERLVTNSKRIEIDLTGSSSDEGETEVGRRRAAEVDEFYLPPPRDFFSTPSRSASPGGKISTIDIKRTASPSKSKYRSPASTLIPPSVPCTPKSKPKPKAKPIATTLSSSTRLLTPSERTQLPLALIRQLDKQVFRKKWSQDGLRCLDGDGEYNGIGLPPGLEVVWNARLRNTAGRARWKKVKVTPASPSTRESCDDGGSKVRHDCTVELATKVTDTEAKLRNTLAHELCHIAAWVLSNEVKPPHGGAFKLWAARIMQVVPDIKVTTTHSYEIVYKFRWRCTSSLCGKIFGRHSNSINPATHGCPCGSKLVEIDKAGKAKAPRPSSGVSKTVLVENDSGEMVEAPPVQKKKKSEWLEFVATQSPVVRKERPDLQAQTEVIKVVAERWRLVKAQLATESASKRAAELYQAQGKSGESGLEGAMNGLRV